MPFPGHTLALSRRPFSFLDIPWYRLAIPHMMAGSMWQDVARTTPAVADSDPVGSALWLGGSTYAEQATADWRPLLRTGANGIGGKAAWSFDATNDFLRKAFGETITQPFTVYAACSFGSTAALRVAYTGLAGNEALFLRVLTTGVMRMHAGSAVDAAVGPTGVQIYSAVFNGASSSMRQNGASIATGNPGTGGLSGVTVGAFWDNTFPLGGLMGFIGIRLGADSVPQQQQIEQLCNSYFSLGF